MPLVTYSLDIGGKMRCDSTLDEKSRVFTQSAHYKRKNTDLLK